MSTSTPEHATVTDVDGEVVHVYRWDADAPAGVVHLLHGMGEHARRYDRLARALVAAGYAVVADDHRASGRTGAEGAGLGNLGPRGQEGALDAVHSVARDAQERDAGLPYFVVGHSWGSFLAQRYADRWGAELAGLVLSGSTLMTMDYIDLSDPNAAFAPARTDYDWLSRDDDEVDRYITDPWCGMEVAFDPAELLHLAAEPSPGLPAGLPVLVVNGSADAVGGRTAGGPALAEAYRAVGLGDVTFLGYEGGRHELFNETNRDEVTADLVAWLDAHTATATGS